MHQAWNEFRFHWFQLPGSVCVLGYALLNTGMVGSIWDQSVNKFFVTLFA
jgi:hypothetical protein